MGKEINQKAEDIRNLIAENQIKDAFDEFHQFLAICKTNNDIRNGLIILSQKYSKYRSDCSIGILTQEQIRVNETIIVRGLLDLIDATLVFNKLESLVSVSAGMWIFLDQSADEFKVRKKSFKSRLAKILGIEISDVAINWIEDNNSMRFWLILSLRNWAEFYRLRHVEDPDMINLLESFKFMYISPGN